MNPLKKLFKRKPKWTAEALDQFYFDKANAMEKSLGEQTTLVGHTIIPFAAGGAVDVYYYHYAGGGTVLATQELINPTGPSPIPNALGIYELVAVTKHAYTIETNQGPFSKIERRFCETFTTIGNYAFEAKVEPGDTSELPMAEAPDRYFIFDAFLNTQADFIVQGQPYGLLLVIEVHKKEMMYAQEHGSKEVLALLKKQGYYPFSDLDRPSVI